ncbi:MAG: TraB/GumN family protein [Candidatus Thorarchaeota archaeon]
MENNVDRIIFVPVIHTDNESVEAARKTVIDNEPDVVAVELDRTRYHQLSNPDPASAESTEIQSGNVIQDLMLQIAKMEKDLGNLTGADVGNEMLAAIEAGRSIGARIALVDRPIEATAQALSQIPLDEIYRLSGVIPGAVENLDEEEAGDIISLLKEDGAVDDLMENFRTEFPTLARVLIDERDEFIARAIKSIMNDVDGKIVVVLGAGHIDGVTATLKRLLDQDAAG